MLQTIGRGLKNFAHNLLDTIHSVFRSTILAIGIVSCVFFSFPILPALLYGFVAAIVGSIVFQAAHRVVDFLSDMFKSSPDVAAESHVSSDARKSDEQTPSSTSRVQTTLNSHPVKSFAEASTQTAGAKMNSKNHKPKVEKPAVDNDEISAAAVTPTL